MAGRKPRMLGHVDALSGSEHAKTRLRAFLKTLAGELKVSEACQELEIEESRFHAARQEWLRESLQLLEPRAVGRPKRTVAPAEPQGRDKETEEQLRATRAQLGAAQILARGCCEPEKKTAGDVPHRRQPR